jgi:hypothetical protein
MFNTPVLEIVIGLVFIFLLYSLLATSIKEGVAATLALRSRMLKRGISVGMLSDSRGYFVPKRKKLLGTRFYGHPILKNYGGSSLYPYPAYLPTTNFSLILVDVLKDHVVELIGVEDVLSDQPDMVQIKWLLEDYRHYHAGGRALAVTRQNCIIDGGTTKILLIYLKESGGNLDDFKKRLERWFDESMNRVSGWYKRQVQIILFVLGFSMALVFNVDTIEIASRLSKDDKLRHELVEKAISYDTNHKGDTTATGHHLNAQADSVVNKDIKDVNGLLALGYGTYGGAPDLGHKMAYVVSVLRWRKFLGFLVLALAVCLGAPFWFDMLSKVINLRGTGAKEGPAPTTAPAIPSSNSEPGSPSQP